MNDTVWYYVDRAQQRRGPVSAAAVADAWRAGDATDTSLVWREGLPEWRPLAEFHAELGLSDAATPAPRPESPTTAAPAIVVPAAPAKGRSGCLIVALVGGLVLLLVIGVLAAIALPAYREYVERAEAAASAAATPDDGLADPDAADPGTPDVDTPFSGTPADAGLVAAAVAEARQHQVLVEEFVANTDRCPRDASEVALPPAASAGVVAITVGEAATGMCTIEIEFGGPGLESLAGERLTLSRDTAGDWYCTSTAADREALPEECR